MEVDANEMNPCVFVLLALWGTAEISRRYHMWTDIILDLSSRG